jgi:hypothetical protein
MVTSPKRTRIQIIALNCNLNLSTFRGIYLIAAELTTNQRELIERYSGQKLSDYFSELPEDQRRYKCFGCKKIIPADCALPLAKEGENEEFSDELVCPECGCALVMMCPLDHNHCSHEIMAGLSFCPLCKQPVCPECLSHDVFQLSRVTGYLQDVGGWNAGKKQELVDRTRYDALNGEMVTEQSYTQKTIKCREV